MDLGDVSDGDIVCLKGEIHPGWVLMTKWNNELTEAYEFTHDKFVPNDPINHRKFNREPIFPEAVYYHNPDVDNFTATDLLKIYEKSEKTPLFRTKIFDLDLLYLLK